MKNSVVLLVYTPSDFSVIKHELESVFQQQASKPHCDPRHRQSGSTIWNCFLNKQLADS